MTENWNRTLGYYGEIHETLRSSLMDGQVFQKTKNGPFNVAVVSSGGSVLKRSPRTYLTLPAARKAAARLAESCLRNDKAFFRGVR
jgi:hypothetical protein